MAVAASSRPRVTVDGKFFRLGDQKFHVKGVAYGPFVPDAAGQPFASPDQTVRDFAQIRHLGANLVRVYHPPPPWFLDLAASHELKVFVDITWPQHHCFLDSSELRDSALQAVRQAITGCAAHPAVFAFSVANEIPPDVVRWSGTKQVADFIDTLIEEAKRLDPGCLCTFSNYPPTEFLQPQLTDFSCFNIYLHNRAPWRGYLARLQMIAGPKPLILGEFGIDSLREGEGRKSAILEWQIEDAFRGGLAGGVVFTFTDDWYTGGHAITDWQMGLTTQDRQPKPSFEIVRAQFGRAPRFPLPRYPRVSVVVASYNGERTLKTCLDSLRRLDYPEYEVILVDDGSTDKTQEIAAGYPEIRSLRHGKNLGLSAARNTGIAASTGEIIAFTDSDCRVDEDWLYYLVGDLVNGNFAALGGPNLLPPEDSSVAAAVMASPGGPAHVMLTDRLAEHIPGCNMAFWKWALVDLGGFDPIFVKAGDDVDICWRLQQAGWTIGFSPSAFVWHYRRSTIREYLKQQRGYGEAEALLLRKHPEYFNLLGGNMWRGRIYAPSGFGLVLQRSIIYRGLFGSAGFQSLYAPVPAGPLMLCTTLEYHTLVTLPLWILSTTVHLLLPLALTSLLLSVVVCGVAAGQAILPKPKTRWWSRPLIAALFCLQPIVRGWARYQGRLAPRPTPAKAQPSLDSLALRNSRGSLRETAYWAQEKVDRLSVVRDFVQRLDEHGWPNRSDVGWGDFDLEIYDPRWCKVQLTTVAEAHPDNKTLLKFRLQARWSMRAAVTFWLLLGAELAIVGLLVRLQPWLGLLLLSVFGFAWFLHRQERDLQSRILVFIDEAARTWGFTRADSERTSPGPTQADVTDLRGSPFRAKPSAEPPLIDSGPSVPSHRIPDHTPS